MLRTIITVARDMSSEAFNDQLDVSTILDKAEQRLFEISQKSQLNKFSDVNSMLEQVLDNWANRTKGALTGIASGFTYLDNMLSGFQKSDLIIIAGRPSMGKTALALTMARNSAVEFKHKVGIFSLEMSNQQLAERLITSEARVDSRLSDVKTNNYKLKSDILLPIVDAVLTCARQRIPLQGHHQDKIEFNSPHLANEGHFAILRLLVKSNPVLREHLVCGALHARYTSKMIQNEILKIAVNQIRSFYRECLKTCSHFSIMADEVICHGKEILSVCLRCLEIGNERFQAKPKT